MVRRNFKNIFVVRRRTDEENSIKLKRNERFWGVNSIESCVRFYWWRKVGKTCSLNDEEGKKTATIFDKQKTYTGTQMKMEEKKRGR